MQILSQGKFRNFDGLIKQDFPEFLIQITLASGKVLKCTPDHQLLLDSNEWINAEYLCLDDKLLYGETISDIAILQPEDVYDILNVEDTHSYYSNGVESHNCNYLYIDEAAIIPNNVAEEFFTATYPTISSGNTTKITLTSTPLGMNFFHKFWSEAEEKINDFVPFRVHYTEHPKRNQAWADEQRKLLGETKFNQEIACQFIGQQFTLVSGEKIASLPKKTPLYLTQHLKQFYAPIKEHSYVILVDTARGLDSDYSAFVVIDISIYPYKVACTFKDNNIQTLVYPELIFRTATKYNNAFVFIETNDLGQQVADTLMYDLEYENIYMSKHEQLKEGGGAGVLPGCKTTKRTKAIGCDLIKNIIENDGLEVNDDEIISELTTFVRVGSTYKADDGKHDDLAMCLVFFGYLTSQPVFKELFDFSLREKFFAEQIKTLEEQMLPIGFYQNGLEDVVPEPKSYNGFWQESEEDFNW